LIEQRNLLSRIIDTLGSSRTAWVLAGLQVAVLGAVNGLDFPLSVPFVHRMTGHVYLDMCGFCSSVSVRNEIVGLGAEGRMLQALLLSTIDVLIPTLSFIFGISALAALTKSQRGPGSRVRWLLALPLLALLLDLAENWTIVALLLRYPAETPVLAGLEGLLSGLKFTAYGLVVLMILILLLARVVQGLRTAEAL